MATEEDRTLAQQGDENPFVMNNPYPAVFMGATRELRQVSLEAAIVSINNLSKFILEVKRENADEFWQAAPQAVRPLWLHRRPFGHGEGCQLGRAP